LEDSRLLLLPRGWITVDGRAVTVRQPEMLARFAGG
jgi:hypothetical protein